MSKKKIFITAFHSFISKNILNTDLFKSLIGQTDLDIWLIVPASKQSFYEANYVQANVRVLSVNTDRITNLFWSRLFSRLAFLLQSSHYLNYKKIERRLKSKNSIKGWIHYYYEIGITKLLANWSVVRKIFRKLFLLVPSSINISNLYDDLSPDVIFSTDVFDESDILISKEARKRNLPIIGMVRSWDNCYSKGVLRVLPDWLVVNNEVIKDEVTTLHDMPAENIFVGGLPQFDAFLKKPITPRDEFCRRVGLDPQKNLSSLLQPAVFYPILTDKLLKF